MTRSIDKVGDQIARIVTGVAICTSLVQVLLTQPEEAPKQHLLVFGPAGWFQKALAREAVDAIPDSVYAGQTSGLTVSDDAEPAQVVQ